MPDTDGLTPDTPGLWLSLTDLASRVGVKKQSLSERLGKLEAQGLVTTRPGPGRTKLINVAEFDRASGSAVDAIRTLNARPRLPQIDRDASDDKILSREQARRVAYQADLSRLDLEARLGKLLPIEAVVAAQMRCAEAMVRSIDQLPTRADDVAAAVGRDGANGARLLLKQIARELRETLARELRTLEAEGLAEPPPGADEPPEFDA